MSAIDPFALQSLLDKQALAELAATYCRAIDRRDYALLKSLYFDDAVEDRGEIFRGSGYEFADWAARDAHHYVLTVHRIFNALFAIDGDRAEGEIYVEAYHRTTGETPLEVVAGGRYLDRYEKRNGRWGFVYRTSTLDRCSMTPVDGAAYEQFVAGSVAGTGDANDLSYRILTRFPRVGQ